MLILILLLVIGAILAYLSKYNFMPVSVNFGWYVLSDIPLFYVIIGSVLFGLILSYVAYLVHEISTSLVIRGKDNEIKKNKEGVLEMTKRVHQLELENEKLKRTPSLEPQDPNAL